MVQIAVSAEQSGSGEVKERRSSDELSDQTRLEMYRLYAEGGTLELVGNRYGYCRVRILQFFEVGNTRRLFTYPIVKPTPTDVETLLDIYRKELAIPRVADYFKMSTTALRKWMRVNGVLDEELRRVATLGRRDRALEEYLGVVEAIGEHPSTTVLQREYRNLAAAIGRLWGNVRTFRDELGIPARALGNPNIREDIAKWTDEQKRRGVERRSSLMEEVILCLKTQGPLTFAELRGVLAGCDIVLREVISKAQEVGLIARRRTAKELRYHLLEPLLYPDSECSAPELRPYENRVTPFSFQDVLPADPLARLKALDRRREGHGSLCDVVANIARESGMRCEDSKYIDLLIDGHILVEVKTLEDDDLKQIRGAVSQLLYYKFVYEQEFFNPVLVAVFSRRPALPVGDAVTFLRQCGIEALWHHEGKLEGARSALASLRVRVS
jgi:hypothetical protein